MEEVLHYLELKNQYYEKFQSLTSKFLEQTNRNQWDDLSLFVDNRDRILNIIRSYDFKISSLFQKLNPSKETIKKYQEKVNELFEIRNNFVQKIVALDLEIISKMEDLKTETIRDLKRTVETNQQLNSFAQTTGHSRHTKTKDA